MNENLQKYYEYLKSVKADVPDTFESFATTLFDENQARTYFDYLKANKFDAPDTFDSFSETLGLKKKEFTVSGTTAKGSELSSTPPSPLESEQTPTVPPKPDLTLTTPELGIERTIPDYLEEGKNIKQPRKETTVIGDLIRSLGSSSLKTLGGIAEIPMLANKTLAGVTIKPLLKAMGASEEEANQNVDYIIGTSTFGQQALISQEAQKKLNRIAQRTEEKMKPIEGGIVKNIGEGEWGKAGELLGRGIVGVIPWLALTASTAGAGSLPTLGVIGATSAAERYAELEGKRESTKLLNSWLYGGFMATGQLITAGLLRGVGRAFRSGVAKQVNPEFVNGIAKGIAKDVGLQTSAGAVVQLGQNITDIVTGVQPDKNVFDGVLDAAIIWGVSGLGIEGAKMSAHLVGRSLASDKELTKVQDNAKQQDILIDQIESTDSDPVKSALEKRIRNLRYEADKITDKNYELARTLSPEQQQKVAELYSTWNALQEKIESGKLSEEEVTTLENTVNGIKEEIESVKEAQIAKLGEIRDEEVKYKIGDTKFKTQEELESWLEKNYGKGDLEPVWHEATEKVIDNWVRANKDLVEKRYDEQLKEKQTKLKEETKDAISTGKGTEESRQQAQELEQGEEERLHLRDNEKVGVETEQREEVKPSIVYATDIKPELKFLEEDLPTKKPNKQDLIDVSDVSGEFRIKPIEKRVTQKESDDALIGVTAKDELRPIMQGILYDTKNQVKVASDAHVLTVIPEAIKGDTRIVNPKTGRVLEGNYPDYLSVVPDNFNVAEVDINGLRNSLVGIDRANSFVDAGIVPISARLVYDGREIDFDPSVLLKGINSLIETGTKKVQLEFPEKYSGAIIIRDINNPKKYSLVMPIERPMRTSTILDIKTNVDKNILKQTLERLKTKEPWGVRYHTEQLENAKKEPNNEWNIEYHTKYLNEAIAERDAKIKEIEDKLSGKQPAKVSQTNINVEKVPIPTQELPTEQKPSVEVKTEASVPLSPESGITPPPETKVSEKPQKEGEKAIGVKFKDKTYTDIDQVQDDFKQFKDLQEYNKVLEDVRQFEKGLRDKSAKLATETASQIGITSKEAEEKIVNEYKRVGDELNVKILPDIPAMVNDVFYKQLVKLRDGLANGVANLLQAGMKSQIDALRWPSKVITNWFGGLGRTQTDIHGKEGEIGKLEMKGTVGVFAEYEAKQVRQKMLDIVNSDPESLERVWSAYDPEMAKKPISFDELIVSEKNLYNLVKDWNTWVWSTNYALGIIPTSSHLKFMDAEGKSTYIARMYDKYEIELMPPEIVEHIKKGSNSVTTKMITDYLHAREEVDKHKQEHAIKDPTYLTAKRIMQTIQNVAIKEYMDAVISEHPDFVKDVAKGEDIPKGYKKLGDSWAWGRFRNKAVINHVVEDFTGFFYANKITNLLYDAAKLFDRNQINQFYKKFRTLYNPMVQLGNMTGNVFFASINGINPTEFIAEQIFVARDRSTKVDEPIYKAVLKSGLMGDVGITGDMTPPKDIIVNKLLKKNVIGKGVDVLKTGSQFASEVYVGTDNVAKYAAYRIFRKRGFTHAQALRRAYDAFQNYTTVGKIWDVASKIPVVGPTFIKFQADLQRIITNAILTTPLTAIGTVMLIRLMGNISSNLSGESDEEKKIRESRKGVAKIPVVNVPLSFKIGKLELNAARYFSPLYVYKNEDSDANLAELSKYLPLQFTKAPKAQLGEKQNVVAFGDATWGWVGSVLFDRDFRAMSIRNPEATMFFNPNLSTDQRIANVLNYVARSQLPFYKSFEDIADGVTGKLDYYGRKRNWYQAIINGIIKVQEFDKPELKRYIEGNIDYLTSKFAGLSEAMGDANALFFKNIQKAEGLEMSKKALRKLYEVEDKERTKNIKKSLDEQVPIMQEIERLTNVHKKWYPKDEFVNNNFMDIEAGRNRIFDVKNDIDLQKKYKEEYNLLKKNNLLKKPEIPNYYEKRKLTEEQRKKYITTYWSEYIRNLDMLVGLTQEKIDKQKEKIESISESKKKFKTEIEPTTTTLLDDNVSTARQQAIKMAEIRLMQEMNTKK